VNVLEISPYEPPASGWVTRVKLLRQLIEARGGTCEILDIGPNRRLARPGCIPVMGAVDYLAKVVRFARGGFTIHAHVNGEYFRGLLLALAATAIARLVRTRCVVTFHAGAVQPFFSGWRGFVLAPVFRLLFLLAHTVVCNSSSVKHVLTLYAPSRKIEVIPAFSIQYLSYREVALDDTVERFLERRSPVLSTYVCFRDGFFIDTMIDAIAKLPSKWPDLGLVIVGTGPERESLERQVSSLGLDRHVILAGDLGHDAFMTLLRRSTVHIRTPVTDGVSATVLEALTQGVPVVASENGSRPAGVVSYQATDPADMARALEHALNRRHELGVAPCSLAVEDTASAEVDLLLCSPQRAETCAASQAF